MNITIIKINLIKEKTEGLCVLSSTEDQEEKNGRDRERIQYKLEFYIHTEISEKREKATS